MVRARNDTIIKMSSYLPEPRDLVTCSGVRAIESGALPVVDIKLGEANQQELTSKTIASIASTPSPPQGLHEKRGGGDERREGQENLKLALIKRPRNEGQRQYFIEALTSGRAQPHEAQSTAKQYMNHLPA